MLLESDLDLNAESRDNDGLNFPVRGPATTTETIQYLYDVHTGKVIKYSNGVQFHGVNSNVGLQQQSRQRGRKGKGVVFRRPKSHDLGSTRTLVTLLRPWIRRFTVIISAWWL